MFSATLHSPDVETLSATVCHKPLRVDLKGGSGLPETVKHALVAVDAREDRSWLQTEPAVFTDGAHAPDRIDLGPEAARAAGREALSEGTKRLKQRLVQRLVDALKMDQALIFCR